MTAQIHLKKFSVGAVSLLCAGMAAVLLQESLLTSAISAQAAAAPPPPPGVSKATKPAPTSLSNTNLKVLVFRNQPSWGRKPDFEETCTDLGIDFVVRPSSGMAMNDLSAYQVIVIPGAQWKTDFYQTFNLNASRFDQYVTNGGVLVLELNGAEDESIVLPRGVSISKHGSRDNTILYPEHPALAAFPGTHIRANFASHGFLVNVPTNALILAAEAVDDKTDLTKPTYIEYPHGAGRVIAACQCFHDRDNSGRGILMTTVLTYAAERKWYKPKK